MLVDMGDAGGLVQPTPIPAPRRLWSDAEWDRLRRGASGGGWTASLVGDQLNLSQSPPGRNIYRGRFRRELAGWKITSAEVEGDPVTYRPGSPQQESERFQSLIEQLLR